MPRVPADERLMLPTLLLNISFLSPAPENSDLGWCPPPSLPAQPHPHSPLQPLCKPTSTRKRDSGTDCAKARGEGAGSGWWICKAVERGFSLLRQGCNPWPIAPMHRCAGLPEPTSTQSLPPKGKTTSEMGCLFPCTHHSPNPAKQPS